MLEGDLLERDLLEGDLLGGSMVFVGGVLSLGGGLTEGGAVYFARWRRVVKGGGGVLFCQGFDGVAD